MLKNDVTLKTGLGFVQDHWKWHQFNKLHMTSYWRSIVTMALSCQWAHKRLLNVFITFSIAFRIDSECPFIERLLLVKTFSQPLLNVT